MRMIAAVLVTLVSSVAFAALKPGSVAPDFTLQAAQAGKEFSFSLRQALMQGPVVLYFYPKSFTSVCTVEAHEFAEAMAQFAAMGASVIGVSSDKIATQREFSTKECRDRFPVGADPDFTVINAYDAAFKVPVAGAMFANRISYVIAPDGKILSVVEDSGATKHIQNALAVVKQWRDSQGK
ncbi:MAG: peroxiredoxin [Methylocystis sp.]|uniref:peroxiredoxin n=1 Tax=Methylocystis sp. TaxID=1911079 RepID=UPI003D1487DC